MNESHEGPAPRSWIRRRPILASFVALLILFALIQLVPYGHDHTNPAVNATPQWPSAEVEQLATSACADCHSNTTEWPKKARVAPISWLVQHDVEEGRSRLNWSEPCGEADDIGEVMDEGEMPPWQYTLIHRDAKLSAAQRDTLAAGLQQALSSLRMSECGGGD